MGQRRRQTDCRIGGVLGIAHPSLELTDPWLKVFTAFYILIGIGILVEVVRRLGFGFVSVLREDRIKVHEAHEKARAQIEHQRKA